MNESQSQRCGNDYPSALMICALITIPNPRWPVANYREQGTSAQVMVIVHTTAVTASHTLERKGRVRACVCVCLCVLCVCFFLCR